MIDGSISHVAVADVVLNKCPSRPPHERIICRQQGRHGGLPPLWRVPRKDSVTLVGHGGVRSSVTCFLPSILLHHHYHISCHTWWTMMMIMIIIIIMMWWDGFERVLAFPDVAEAIPSWGGLLLSLPRSQPAPPPCPSFCLSASTFSSHPLFLKKNFSCFE